MLKRSIFLENISTSQDTLFLKRALDTNLKEINVGLAGTAMRFLISYFSIQEGKEIILKGEKSLNQRPIGGLINSLKSIGADIEYLEKKGFPPVKIKGKNIICNKVKINAGISSQFISSLLLISPFLKNGLEIELEEKKVSYSYIDMTLNLLSKFGVEIEKYNNIIKIKKGINFRNNTYKIESDWSSASYYFSKIALTGGSIKLSNFIKKSIQADRKLVEIYRDNFGVNTIFSKECIFLEKKNVEIKKNIDVNLNYNPDIAQTIAVTCLGLRLNCRLKGLETLKIKETDRLFAMKNELEKFGAKIKITDSSLEIINYNNNQNKKEIFIKTYNDHRMAMSFAPLLSLGYRLTFEDKEVVKKSYPNFWEDFMSII